MLSYSVIFKARTHSRTFLKKEAKTDWHMLLDPATDLWKCPGKEFSKKYCLTFLTFLNSKGGFGVPKGQILQISQIGQMSMFFFLEKKKQVLKFLNPKGINITK